MRLENMWGHDSLTTDDHYRQAVSLDTRRKVVCKPDFLLFATRSKAQRVEAAPCFHPSPVNGIAPDQDGDRILARDTDNDSFPRSVSRDAKLIVGERIHRYLRLLNRECGRADKRQKQCWAT